MFIKHISELSSYNENFYKLEKDVKGANIIVGICNEEINETIYRLGIIKPDKMIFLDLWFCLNEYVNQEKFITEEFLNSDNINYYTEEPR